MTIDELKAKISAIEQLIAEQETNEQIAMATKYALERELDDLEWALECEEEK